MYITRVRCNGIRRSPHPPGSTRSGMIGRGCMSRKGTLHVRNSFLLRAAISGLADLPVQVILGAFDDRTTREPLIGALPENMKIVQWVSHDQLLPRTAVMVTT